MEQRDEGFLPPEPAGPEPDMGGQTQPPQPPPQQQQQPPPGYQPPPAYQPPPGGYAPPPPPVYQPPPPAYQPPAPGYYGWQPPPPQPGNGPAVAGFVTAAVSGALWLFSAGLGTPLSIPGAIVGMVLARQGKRKVEDGETTKHKDLATAGWWIGIAVLVLSVISTIVWVLIFVLAANSDNSSSSDPGFNSQNSALRVGLALVGLSARLFS